MHVVQNLRHGLRTLLHQPAFTAVAVITLALGIGANTAIFSVIHAVVLRPLPFKDSERFVHLWSQDRLSLVRQWVSYPDFADWRRQSRNFERMAAWVVIDGMTLLGGPEAERVEGAGVFGDLFPMLGVPPVLGTTFRAESEFQDAVVVLSYGLWQRRYNSDPNVLGQNITIDGENFTVIGVMPEGFQFPIQTRPVDLWATFGSLLDQDSQFLRRNFRGFEVMGLLKPGANIEQARTEMDVIASALGQQYPEDKDFRVLLVPELENIAANVSRPLAVLFAAVGAVLLIACVNVANLLLAKTTGRKQEMAIRAALGASRVQLCAQLFTESWILSLAGGGLGAILAMWVLDSLVALVPGNLPRANEIGLDLRVLGFTALLSVAAGILFGLAPAWYASRIDLRAGLQEPSRTVSEAAGRKRLRDALVVAEIALALMLLTASGLLLNSFWRLLRLDLGYDRTNIVSLMMNVPYNDPARLADFSRRLQEQVQTIPNVRGASVFAGRPPSFGVSFEIEGRRQPENERPPVSMFTVQPGFMNALGIPLISGRDFTQRDDGNAPFVLIINQTLANRYFANENPIGKRLRLRVQMTGREFPPKEIIGVVGDSRLGVLGNLDRGIHPQIYLPAAQDPFVLNYFSFLVKTEGDPMRAVPALRAAALTVDKQLPIYQVTTLEELAGQSRAQERFNAVLLAVFSGLALVLAAIGLYGVLSYAVALRTSEIGIRVAMGARSGDVMRLVIMNGIKLTMAGVLIGLTGALALTRLIEGLLFGVSATDPLTFVVVTLLLLLVAFLACWIPARRAARVDPIIALRFQ
jgi:putative ABC transport system permease protein